MVLNGGQGFPPDVGLGRQRDRKSFDTIYLLPFYRAADLPPPSESVSLAKR
jgi:hypothetical protein